MRIILSGGGTGGHIYPALTILKTIKKIKPDTEFLYVGTSKGLEADIVPRENIPFKTIEIAGFKRKLTPENIKIFAKAFGAVFKAKAIIDEFKPDVVIGTGGYVCGPILLAASLKGVPALIQEQNAVPGITNKFLGKFVNKVAVGYEAAMKYFQASKTVFTGNPIRPEFLEDNKGDDFAALGLDAAKQTVLVSGGSRGAHTINQAMLEVHKKFYGSKDVQIIHVTGQLEYDFVIDGLKALGINLTDSDNIKIYPYLYNMPGVLNRADLCVFRAGASSLAELTAVGVPAILVPYPYAAANHQEMNARELEAHGAAKVILNKDLMNADLGGVIEKLLSDKSNLRKMKSASKALGKIEAADDIAQLVINLGKK